MPKEQKPLERISDIATQSTVVLTLGEFQLCVWGERFWLERQSGEGMELKKKNLEEIVRKYWEEHF